jgi:hypothetical protein
MKLSLSVIVAKESRDLNMYNIGFVESKYINAEDLAYMVNQKNIK